MLLSYNASPVEAEWFDSPPDGSPTYKIGKICSIAALKSQTSATRDWLSFAESFRGSSPRTPTVNESVVLSHFVGKDGCLEHIEPLTGIARHPWAQNLGCRNRWDRSIPKKSLPDKYAISHLVLANHCDQQAGDKYSRPQGCGRNIGRFGQCRRNHTSSRTSTGQINACPRNLLYDLGCSIYGRPLKRLNAGSGLGPSLPLISALYEHNCIEFDQMFAWEAKEFEPRAWWRYVPDSVRARLHFYNVPVELSSFLTILNRTATPADFVVVKVDIDTPHLEKEIVRSIASSSVWASLIDELYFEYHFHYGGGHGPWGNTQHTNSSGPNYLPDSVDDALGLMRKLREMGVRSHFWI